MTTITEPSAGGSRASSARLGPGPTVVEVWAPRCTECIAMASDLRSVAAEYAGRVGLETVNAADEPNEAVRLGVRGTPTLIGYRDGEEVLRLTGRRSRSELFSVFGIVAGDAPDSASIGRQDLVLSAGAGLALAVGGILAGPAWVLLGLGVTVAALGVARWAKLRT